MPTSQELIAKFKHLRLDPPLLARMETARLILRTDPGKGGRGRQHSYADADVPKIERTLQLISDGKGVDEAIAACRLTFQPALLACVADPILRTMIAAVLQQHRIEFAGNADAACRAVAQLNPAMVICDSRLPARLAHPPGGRAFETVLKALGNPAAFLLLTADAGELHGWPGIGVLMKPFAGSQLSQKVRTVLENSPTQAHPVEAVR